MDKDLYEVLGVSQTAKEAEIRKAFLSLAKKYHPDVNPGNKTAETKFKEVNLAYEVLKDSKKRAQYDQMRALGADPFRTPYSGSEGGYSYSTSSGGKYSDFQFDPRVMQDFGLGDLFDEIFSSRGARHRRPEQKRSSPFGTSKNPHTKKQASSSQNVKQDVELSFSISFLEAIKGGERSVTLPDGRVITVKIPEGVDTGSKIKLSGQARNAYNQPCGDVILNIQVQNHPYFFREGKNVVLRLPISFSEAVLGAEIEIPTVSGSVVLTIPKGVSSGQRLKLSGKGVKTKQEGTGDQFVEILIRVPKDVPKKYLDVAQELKEIPFNPRAGVF